MRSLNKNYTFPKVNKKPEAQKVLAERAVKLARLILKESKEPIVDVPPTIFAEQAQLATAFEQLGCRVEKTGSGLRITRISGSSAE